MSRYGIDNRQKIIEAFAKLALKKSFRDISLKEISGLAGISTTQFYTYFKSKDDMLKYYAEYLLEHIENIVKDSFRHQLGLPSKIRGLIYIFSTLMNDEKLVAFHRVFREFEFIREDLARLYYANLFRMISNILNEDRILIEAINPLVATLTIIGSAEFIYLFRQIFGVPGNILIDIEVAGDLILKGLGGDKIPPTMQIKPSKDLVSLVEEYEIYRSANISENKWNILIATINTISSKTFREAKIYEIMEKTGYSVGMFYKFYKSKEDLLRDLVALIGKTLRRYLTLCTSEARDPIELEIMGTACFLGFIEKNSNIYRIVRESEYIDIEIAKAYYIPFLRAYAKRIEKDRSKGLVNIYEPESLAISLMGINHMAGIMNMILGEPDSEEILTNLAKIYSMGLLRRSLST
ncbi:MAG: TetR/AcrR family transcriptional regulator [Sulfolobales archaeon]